MSCTSERDKLSKGLLPLRVRSLLPSGRAAVDHALVEGQSEAWAHGWGPVRYASGDFLPRLLAVLQRDDALSSGALPNCFRRRNSGGDRSPTDRDRDLLLRFNRYVRFVTTEDNAKFEIKDSDRLRSLSVGKVEEGKPEGG